MVAENVQIIRSRIASACGRAGRSPEEIRLVAVSKTFDAMLIAEAVKAGVADIGENYVQEIRSKHESLNHLPIRWHFIGHLQSNKLKYIAPWISCIQAVDSVTIAREISKQAERSGREIEVLVEVNTSGERSKFGLSPGETPEILRQIAALPRLRLGGLMTIGPFLPDPEASRAGFRALRQLRDSATKEGLDLRDLSMGMTNDFEVAIEEGATILRIGTAIFGSREAGNA